MKQLEKRFYTREEIAEILSVNPADTSHYKRNVEAKLQKWGYSYEYAKQGTTIIRQPETPEERLKELLIRKWKIDVQVDAVAFACFIRAFWDIEGFDSMPWAERERLMFEKYGYSVCERTLRNWCSKLLSRNCMAQYKRASCWKTFRENGIKRRIPVEPGDEEMEAYFCRRSELLQAETVNLMQQGKPLGEAKKLAWDIACADLWQEFHCYYYSCKGFTLNGIDCEGDGALYEIYELSWEIVSQSPMVN